jgi:hypothetical protein
LINVYKELNMSKLKEEPLTIKAEFLLPVRDKDGTDLTDLIETFLDEISLDFLWSFEGSIQGVWKTAEGEIEHDICQRYFVLMEEKSLPDLENHLRSFKSRTKQDAILLIINRNVEQRLI